MSTTDAGNSDQGNGTIAEAASAFERILEGDSPTQRDEEDASDDAEGDEPEAQATSDDDETPEADAEGAEDEEAAANDDDAEEEAQEPAERLITVKIDGNVMQLPEAEVAAGYQRQADYSRHMQSLQQERHEVRQERAQYAQLLPALVEQLQQLMPQEPDWEQLYNSDPLEYVRQRELKRDRDERMAAASIEHQRMSQLQQEQEAAELHARVAEGREQLHAYNPAWKDKTRWEADRQQLRQYLGKTGFSEEEIGKAYDPRAVTLAHKAMLYDRIMSKKPVPVRPRSPTPATGGVAQTMPTRKHSEQSKAKMRLAKTGSVRDAAKVFEGLL
jgi:hypothetical protein